ncbi:MAG TPA: ankyrin repeat domain-containing protein [Thiolinea sp.]|nr:ankyrin repeat domain-containing protein [Thiolinea sp.]
MKKTRFSRRRQAAHPTARLILLGLLCGGLSAPVMAQDSLFQMLFPWLRSQPQQQPRPQQPPQATPQPVPLPAAPAQRPVQPPAPLQANLPPTRSVPQVPGKTQLPEPEAEKYPVRNRVKYDNSLDRRLMYTLQNARRINDIRWLLDEGANPNYVDETGASPVYVAVRSGWVQLAEMLREAGGDFIRPTADGTTTLHIAVAAGQMKMAQYLVDLGCSVNAKTNKGWLPLHHAARFGHVELARYMLQLGNDPNARNSDGLTPLQLAEHARHMQVVHLLRPHTNMGIAGAGGNPGQATGLFGTFR